MDSVVTRPCLNSESTLNVEDIFVVTFPYSPIEAEQGFSVAWALQVLVTWRQPNPLAWATAIRSACND